MGYFKFSISRKYGLMINLDIHKYHLRIRFFRLGKLKYTMGIRNSCEGSPHRILFLDYDEISLELLIPELKWLQKNYKLSDIYLFESSQKEGSYHAISLDKLKPRTWAEILPNTNTDQNYQLAPIHLDNRNWVLRCIKKSESEMPRLIKIIKSKYQQRTKSQAHALFLKHHYKIDINLKKLKNLDKTTKVMMIAYGTMNYLDLKKPKNIKEITPK